MLAFFLHFDLLYFLFLSLLHFSGSFGLLSFLFHSSDSFVFGSSLLLEFDSVLLSFKSLPLGLLLKLAFSLELLFLSGSLDF